LLSVELALTAVVWMGLSAMKAFVLLVGQIMIRQNRQNLVLVRLKDLCVKAELAKAVRQNRQRLVLLAMLYAVAMKPKV